MNTVGSRLLKERERLGKSQTEMAEQGGVKKNAQINYEKDKRSPDADYLTRIANAGADVNYILTGRRGGEAVNEAPAGYAARAVAQEIVEIYEALDAEGQEWMIHAAEHELKRCRGKRAAQPINHRASELPHAVGA